MKFKKFKVKNETKETKKTTETKKTVKDGKIKKPGIDFKKIASAVKSFITRKIEQAATMKAVSLDKVGKTSIRMKLNVTIFGVMILFILLLTILGIKATQYSKQYEAVLDNITKITYIKTNCSKVASTIKNLYNFNSDIEESGHIEIMENVENYLVEIKDNIGDDPLYGQNRNLYDGFATEVNKYLADFNSILEVCGDVYNKDAGPYAENMLNESPFITTKADSLLTAEIDRSETVQKKIAKEFKVTILVIVIVTLLAIIAALLIVLFVSNGIVTPVILLQKNLMTMADGDLTGGDVSVTTSDEIGQATVAFNKMKSNLVQIITKVKDNSSELQCAINTVNCSVEENAKGSERVAQSVEGMLGNLEKQHDEIQKLVQQSDEMNGISKTVSEDADQIYQQAQKAQDSAKDGMSKMNAYVEQMEEVNHSMEEMEAVFTAFGKSAKEMSSILDSIVEIAEQTNLLSLNASIEAARAGEAGRGFAVVATEIHKLADDSQMSANKIGKIIHNVENEVDEMKNKLQQSMENLKIGNKITEETKVSFEGIQGVTEEVGGSVDEIIKKLDVLLGMIDDTTNGMNMVSQSADNNVSEINDISAVVAEETANLEEVSSTMDSVLILTGELDGMVSSFTVEEAETDEASDEA